MKNFSKFLTGILILSSMVLPFIPIFATAQEEEEEIIFRFARSSDSGDWDPAISRGVNIQNAHYMPQVLEYPYGLNAKYDGGIGNLTREQMWIPILVTDWETDWRDTEINGRGFNNSNGRKSINYTLREGVKFHDGSDWNATVFKWNIDRLYLITGNLTGEGETHNAAAYWSDVETWKDLFSENWDLSEYDDVYAGYIVGKHTKYPGITPDENGVVRNPVPYGGLSPLGSPIHNAPYDKFPIVREVKIIENKTSGGKIQVIFNSWNTYGGEGGVYLPYKFSYAAYYRNYTGRGIYGYTNGVKDPRNPTIVDHMIGTGPYKYVTHSETASPAGGYMIKNEDYWNKTALEADGWFDIDRLEVINLPQSQYGKDTQNTAILTGAIDYCYSSMYLPVDLDAVKANPNIDFIETYPSTYTTVIRLNCINETYWADPNAMYSPTATYDAFRKFAYADKEDCGGIPRAMRKAMSYVMDYDLYINTVLDGQAVHGGNALGIGNIYYNESIPMPTYDIEYAREILLTTECNATGGDGYTRTPNANIYNFSKLCADRGLTADSTDDEWEEVADTNPIFVLDLYWDDTVEDLKNVFGEGLTKIGVAYSEGVKTYDNKAPGVVYDTVSTYWLNTFDGKHSIWSAQAYIMPLGIPRTIPEGYVAAMYDEPFTKTFPRWNWVFCYDKEIDELLAKMFVSTSEVKYEVISDIAYKLCNEIYPYIYVYQQKGGGCLWKEWESFYITNRAGQRSFFYELENPTFYFLRYVGLPGPEPLIPGSPLVITLTVSAITMIGIIYIMMRKKRIR